VTPPIRALGLLSGGLDSALAARLLLDQGLEVIGLHLESPTACRADVRAVAAELGIELIVRAKGEEYVRLLRNPRWGYGKHMNPCIDCRHYMFQIAAGIMPECGAQFLFTGEVLGQRPMSQMRNSLELIDRAAGLVGRVLRPLSAGLLDETEPERLGWVDRSKLLAVSGRARHAQLALAERHGLTHHQAPGGGCLLTEMHFSRKLADLFANDPNERATMEDLALLKVGRHVRIRPDLKIVLGRDRDENARLEGFARGDRLLVTPVGFGGPTALVCGAPGEDGLGHAIRLIVEYSKRVPTGARVRLGLGAGEEERLMETSP